MVPLFGSDKNKQLLINSLQVSLNKDAKLILEPQPTSSALETFLGWSTLAERRVYHRCLYVYKSLHQLDWTLKTGADIHFHNTRHKNNLRPIAPSTTKGLLRSQCYFIKDWNALPVHFREYRDLISVPVLHAELLGF